MNPSDKYEQIKDIKHLNPVELEAMVLHHAQQIKDIAKHLLELQRYMEFKREPVAWGVFEGNLHDMFFTEAEAVEMADLKGTHAEVMPLFIHPQRPWKALAQFIESVKIEEKKDD